MNARELERRARHRLAVLDHAVEVTGSAAEGLNHHRAGGGISSSSGNQEA